MHFYNICLIELLFVFSNRQLIFRDPCSISRFRMAFINFVLINIDKFTIIAKLHEQKKKKSGMPFHFKDHTLKSFNIICQFNYVVSCQLSCLHKMFLQLYTCQPYCFQHSMDHHVLNLLSTYLFIK